MYGRVRPRRRDGTFGGLASDLTVRSIGVPAHRLGARSTDLWCVGYPAGVIVVVGSPIAGRSGEPSGQAVAIALAAAAGGAPVELVGAAPDDAIGDAMLLALGRAGVGHVAVLRRGVAAGSDAGVAEPAPLDAADLELALGYLREFRVLVLVDPAAELRSVAADGAAYGGAHLIAIVGADSPTAGLPTDATVIEAPRSDPDGAFAGFVAAYAVQIDGGATPAEAWRTAANRTSVEPAG